LNDLPSAKRLRRHQNHVLTFLDREEVPFDYNFDEGGIRSVVIMRKNSHGNGLDQGADAQVILISIFRTLRKQGHHPTQTVTNALASYIQTGRLPPLPAPPRQTANRRTQRSRRIAV
jgi:alpha-D-ribose 1-methylphosphonate 5-phosphate C-P lyase